MKTPDWSRMGKKGGPNTAGFHPRKKLPNPPSSDSDTSIDSKGNIKGLIDYEYTSTEDYAPPKKISPVAGRTRSGLKKRSRERTRGRGRDRYEETSASEDEDLDVNNAREHLIASLQKERDRLKALLKEKNTHSGRRKKSEISTPSASSEAEEDEEEEEEEEDDDSEYYGDEEDNEEEDEEEEGNRKGPSILLSFGMGAEADKNVPKRHNLKKESAEVNQFVKLITTEPEENTIDTQIDQFKALPDDKRAKLLSSLEIHARQPSLTNPEQSMLFKILTLGVSTEIQSMILHKYKSLQGMEPGSGDYHKMRNWIEKAISVPFGIYKEIPARLSDGSASCGEFMERARRYLDEAIFGQNEAKLQILQFIGMKIANPTGRGTCLLLAGPPGIGKTSLIKNGVAKALQWPFQFVSLGGDSDATSYVGHQVVYEGSHCGKIVNSLVAAKSMSLVLMFDEVDKISKTPKGEEVQNLLVHLTDPVQNEDFEDKYLTGLPIDLSRVMMTFSANYLENLDPVLLDRMTVIELKGYDLKQKATIAENYLLPQALKEVDLAEKIGFSKDVLLYIIENYAKEEKGVRQLKRCIEQVAQKLNMLRMFNTKDLPFHIKDFSLPFVMTKDYVDVLLKSLKKEQDQSFLNLYV
jgi:ATP-dependent Clp protease ATP-binding subunit ClpA